MGQDSIRGLLQEKFAESRSRNPAISLRAFAKRLGIGSSALSEILNGKRKVSLKLVRRISESLCLDPIESREILKGLELLPKVEFEESVRLSADQYKVISEWYHFAILSLVETKSFRNDSKWIAKRLGLHMLEVREALGRLLRLELIVEDKDGRLVSTGKNVHSPDGVSNAGLKAGHFKNLELGRRSLEKDGLDSRDFTAITMAIDPKKLPVAKKMVREFRDRLNEYLESGHKTEVYKLCIQLFPLTEKEEERL